MSVICRLLLLAVMLLGWLASIEVASAQDRIENPCVADGQELRCLDLQLFHPTAASGTTFTIDRPDTPRHLGFEIGVAGSYALSPLRRVDESGNTEDVVESLGQIELLFALGLFEAVEVGVALPFNFASVADNALSDTLTYHGASSLGDIRLSAKIPLLHGEFALAARTIVTLPFADDQDFLGPGYWTLYPNLVAAFGPGNVRFGAELGYRLRREAYLGTSFEQDDELQASLGVNVSLIDLMSAVAETSVRLGVGGDFVRSNENPWVLRGGVRIVPVPSIQIDVGAGFGVLSGYGAPTVRPFAIARYVSEPERCAEGPEDFDGFEDGDFCADPDNDGDGLVDSVDACPNDAEDPDGFADDDGCPDPDNDADAVMDADDQCPLESEDIDGYEDNDGCPERDNDEDGLTDGVDACPMEPEDQDGFEDEDGCPEPGPETQSVTVGEHRILISDRIYFDYDRDTIRPVSQPMLDAVAAAMPQVRTGARVRVEGYTDDAGEPNYNTDLSYRRARAVVEYLVAHGVSRSRLTFEGYGEQSPVAPNDSPEGRALNRRVEFTIIGPEQN